MRVAVVMGSDSDWKVMEKAVKCLESFEVSCDAQVISAHRTPDKMFHFSKKAHEDYSVIIAGAGGAAHLPGMIASITTLPVIGVPIAVTPLQGEDSLLSIVQMPKGVPVATVGINNAWNAGLLAVKILSLKETQLVERLKEYQKDLQNKVDQMKLD